MSAPHAPEARSPASGGIAVDAAAIRLGEGANAFDVVEDIDLAIPDRQFVCLLGPSGCGKSTLLGALAGHLGLSRGRALLDGQAIREPHPERGIVFQHHTLFPWKSVIENVAFGLKMQGVGRAERLARAREYLALVGLDGFAERYPAELSGGMQQRVEIARVLVNGPRVLLMDEPFGALDAQTRLVMQELLLDVWTRRRTTVVFVTHDIDEALFLGDRVLVMTPRPGRILDDIAVPFARPRRRDLVAEPEFAALKRRCLDLLRPRTGTHPLPRLTPLGLPNGASSPAS
ncbi:MULTISPECIES: ABC transporter ATP-binding protein [Methylobacterium]|uniref:Bicarbonate transport ATP-binding protein CmpD n=2 Tax=Pseudomonadota TaxID=1224 RepID=A0ABQ4SUK2_9HYPH|nr:MULTISPECIES: ABC transporter ATP-binding protein [Methylobacterium]PIU07506.1 MAG: sulfonate ABC transporter ATP-binding protein [Methylobacterium sp. CG09_land_8_20_14_0_10_71_15]PIU13293.1 MAG: sulfonate ABC transporter ATP-binding protein [Methylobacterium sp. CG08_land_8_20_14_0_20_71_15]GBU17797.1 taurine ABC transporter ATPase [Methylobacterium sp.]GJE06772.1 Bicarbonate transport ATP-binding protein CmpD [Methylobacterium jeotgali]